MKTQTIIRNLEKVGLESYVTFPDNKLNPKERLCLIEECLGIETIACAHQLFPQIDFAFLGMKHPTQVDMIEYRVSGSDPYGRSVRKNVVFRMFCPRFAVYILDSPICRLKVTMRHEGKIHSGKLVAAHLESDIPELLNGSLLTSFSTERQSENYHEAWKDSDKYVVFEYISYFGGILPLKNKRNIQQAKKLFGDRLYLVAEADWEIKRVQNDQDPSKNIATKKDDDSDWLFDDPLIIGCVGNTCYLVDQFDCTPAEEYVRREFKK